MYARAMLLALLVTVGSSCTYRDPSIDLLEGELRWMEDQLFMLEDELDAKCAQLAECRQSQSAGAALMDGVVLDGAPICSDSTYYDPPSHASSDQPDIDILPEPSPLRSPAPQAAEESTMDLPREPEPATSEPSIDIPPTASDTQDDGYSIMEPSIDLPPESEDASPAPIPQNDGYQIVEPSVELPPSDMSPSADDELPEPTPAQPSLLDEPSIDLPPDTPAEQPGSGTRPQIDPGTFDSDLESDFGPPPPMESEPGSSTRLDRGSIQLQSHFVEESWPAASASASHDAHVTHIAIEGTVSTGYDFDGEPGKPGLLVVIEPRNEDGGYVALAGPVSVVVLDGSREGANARIERWDFDAASARRRIRVSEFGRGIHLELPWTGTPPDSDELHVFVRYTNMEGRELESDALLADGRTADRWKPSPRRVAAPQYRKSTVRQAQFETRPINPVRETRVLEEPVRLQPIDTVSPAQFVPAKSDVHSGVAPATYTVDVIEDSGEFATSPITIESESPAVPASRRIARPEWRPYR